MTTENILMSAVKKGGDRQELHEKIRQYSMEAGNRVKQHGEENNLLELIAQDPAFGLSEDELSDLLEPRRYIGRSANLVKEFIETEVQPVLEQNKEPLGMRVELKV
jgi:adenylosuccinate lyase